MKETIFADDTDVLDTVMSEAKRILLCSVFIFVIK